MVSPSCGERDPDGARFCLNCGVPLSPAVRPDEELVTVRARVTRSSGRHVVRLGA